MGDGIPLLVVVRLVVIEMLLWNHVLASDHASHVTVTVIVT